MREIMEVAKYIRKELKMADEYAYEALKHKEEYPDMSQHYARAAQEHLDMTEELHHGAVRLIEMAKRTEPAPTGEILRMWNFEHEMMLDEKDCVMRKLAMYK